MLLGYLQFIVGPYVATFQVLAQAVKIREAEAERATCLDRSDLRPSMDLARKLITARNKGHVFPNVVGGDDNLIFSRVNCGRKALSIQTEREVID
jgi:hypothetical protein